jgi:hypothetical protein
MQQTWNILTFTATRLDDGLRRLLLLNGSPNKTSFSIQGEWCATVNFEQNCGDSRVPVGRPRFCRVLFFSPRFFRGRRSTPEKNRGEKKITRENRGRHNRNCGLRFWGWFLGGAQNFQEPPILFGFLWVLCSPTEPTKRRTIMVTQQPLHGLFCA